MFSRIIVKNILYFPVRSVLLFAAEPVGRHWRGTEDEGQRHRQDARRGFDSRVRERPCYTSVDLSPTSVRLCREQKRNGEF